MATAAGAGERFEHGASVQRGCADRDACAARAYNRRIATAPPIARTA